MLYCESLIASVSPRLRPGTRTFASCLNSRATRSGVDAGGVDSGVGAAVAGAAVGVEVATGVGWMYT